jgi:hypothetical protein
MMLVIMMVPVVSVFDVEMSVELWGSLPLLSRPVEHGIRA